MTGLISGWCLDARSGHFPKLAHRMHTECAERLADPTKKPDECSCPCHERDGLA
jgi:hypothetical protein